MTGCRSGGSISAVKAAYPAVPGPDPVQQQAAADFAPVRGGQFGQQVILEGALVPGEDILKPGAELGGRNSAMGGNNAGHNPFAAQVVRHSGRDGGGHTRHR